MPTHEPLVTILLSEYNDLLVKKDALEVFFDYAKNCRTYDELKDKCEKHRWEVQYDGLKFSVSLKVKLLDNVLST